MRKVLYLFLLISVKFFAAKEEVISSFQSGVITTPNVPFVTGNQVIVEDSWNFFMTSNPITYTNLFKVKESKFLVRLRYDDSKKFDFGNSWALNVTYHVEYTDIFGNVTSTSAGSSNLSINYLKHSAPTNYTDISINTHSNPDTYKMRVIVDGITFTPTGGPSQTTIPLAFEDIYMDVIVSTERYYVLGTIAPTVNVQSGFLISNTFGDANVRLPLAWNYVSGAESYDLEWLYIDIGTSAPTAGFSYDFKNATRVNTLENHYEIPLTYANGIILYRVRPVGFNWQPPDLIRVEGQWSDFTLGSGNTSVDAPVAIASKRYDYSGLELQKNWAYKSSFSEEAKRKEAIIFSDGGLKQRQVVASSTSDNNVIISEPVYDFEGRPAIGIIPTPIISSGIKYYGSTPTSNFNQNYNPANFDMDATINNPDPFLPGFNDANYFYSANNTTNYGINYKYIPDATNFPYQRTRYTTDGTSRIKSQSHYGSAHRTGSGHEVKFVYGKPMGFQELDRVFGNEVGIFTNYFKTGQIDENGQSTITYYDNHGRTIATCLSGNAPANLFEIDNKPPGVPVTIDLLGVNNVVNSTNQLVSSTPLVVLATTTYHFIYDLKKIQYCKTCGSFNFCEDCKYDLTVKLTDENGNLVSASNFSGFSGSPIPTTSPNPITFSNIDLGTFSFDVTLLPGTYAMDKILEVNQTNLATITSQYINNQILNPTCLVYPQINPAPCNNTCKLACEERYKRYDFTTSTYYYVDDNEVPISVSAATVLIASCEGVCENPKIPEQADYCSLQLIALKKDMSPGGQYFSNTMGRLINDPIQGVIENPAYNEFGWLTTNLASASSSIFSSLTVLAGSPITTWQDVKDKWQDNFLTVLVYYHPEYCAYDYFCDGEIFCTKGAAGTTTISIANSNDFDDILNSSDQTFASAHGFFNTISYPVSSAHNPSSDYLFGNETYCPYTSSGASVDQDPFVAFGCSINLKNCASSSGSYLTENLKKFLHIGGGNYYSIWYVLDDPGNIHLIPTASSTTPPQATIDYFKTLHGDGTPANPGLFASVSKWEFFRSTYAFYKQLFIYDYYVSTSITCPPPSTQTPLAPSPASVSITHSNPTIHFPANAVFSQIINNTTGICTSFNGSASLVNALANTATVGVTNVCASNCSLAADGWMQQLLTCSLSVAATDSIRKYLIEVCKKECDATNIYGSSGCDPMADPTCTIYVSGPSGSQFYNFNDVITYFSSATCSVNIIYPAQETETGCSCAGLTTYVNDNGLNFSNPSAIATALNADFGTSFTATDVSTWKTLCDNSSTTMAQLNTANFPSGFKCTAKAIAYDVLDCSCNKLTQFILNTGYDPNNTADHPYIVAAINNYFALPPGSQINATQLVNVLSACSAGTVPDYAFFATNNVPMVLLCPEPASSDPEDILAAQELSDCQFQSLMSATSYAVQQFNFFIANETFEFKAAYTDFCLKKALETFSVSYTLDEYMFTLYYYDQAGNLVKTVPPEGVEFLTTAAAFQAVMDYRNGIVSTPTYPPHRMVTRNMFDSYEGKLEYETPDGGLIKYWYDIKGRLVVSQDAKQRNYVSPGAGFNRTIYDKLGRIFRTKQIFTTAPLTYDDARTPGLYSSWLSTHLDSNQITRFYYDEVQLPVPVTVFGTAGQKNLHNRVSHVDYEEVNDSNPATYDYATHYSYDLHGMANVVVHENNYKAGSTPLFSSTDKYQKSEMEYDVICGNIYKYTYQKDKIDALYQTFSYDANNRLVKANSSTDGVIFDNDAKYYYYATGQLARKEMGDKNIQGSDYAYTINGWLRGHNSSIVSSLRDIGRDGLNVPGNLNSVFATDGFGASYGYFKNDYQPIDPLMASALNSFEADPFTFLNDFGDFIVSTNPMNLHDYSLYNGIVSYNVQNSQIPTGGFMGTYGKAYQYDQEYRVKFNTMFTDPAVGILNLWAPTTANTNTREEFEYDFNGNISRSLRDVSTVPMDQLNYNYYLNGSGKKINNKLYCISEIGALDPNFPDDIDANQPCVLTIGSSNPDTDPLLNYGYTENGELYKDQSEGIRNVQYDAKGKITNITRQANFYKQVGASYFYPSDFEFHYDQIGRRIVKVEKPWISSGPPTSTMLSPSSEWKYSIYAYDAGGRIAAIYTYQKNNSTSLFELKVTERYSYGQTRAAQINEENLMTAPVSLTHFERELGLKTFELASSSENVNTTLLDYRVSGNTSGTIVNFYKPAVMSAVDYFANGTSIPGRKYITEKYRYGRNGGSEKDDEIMMGIDNMYTTYYRELDTRVGRWWSLDPMANAQESPYVVNHNNSLNTADPMGDIPSKGGLSLSYSGKNGFNLSADNIPHFKFRKDDQGGWVASVGFRERSDKKGEGGKDKGIVAASVNVSLRKYSKGLGTSGGFSTFDLVVTPAISAGFGTYTPVEQNLFNSYSLFAVDDDYMGSLSYGVNFVMNSDGRSQAVGGLLIRGWRFTLGGANDVRGFLLFLSEGDDKYWTGSFRLGMNLEGTKLSSWKNVAIGTEVFTGRRIVKNPGANAATDKYYTYTDPDGQLYYTQTPEDVQLTNGVTWASVEGLNKKFSMYGNGPLNAMWIQNAIHKNMHLPYFESKEKFKFVITKYSK
jgi:hypothetical protein